MESRLARFLKKLPTTITAVKRVEVKVISKSKVITWMSI